MWTLVWIGLSGCENAGPPVPEGFPSSADITVPTGIVAPDAPAPAVLLLVGDAGVALDPRPWYDALGAEAPSTRMAPGWIAAFEKGKIADEASAHELAIPALTTALGALRDEAPRSLAVTLVADASLPFELVRRVIFSASMAQLQGIDLVVTRPDGGRGALHHPFPVPCDAGEGPTCVLPRLERATDGWWVTAQQSQDRPTCSPGVLAGARTVFGEPTAGGEPWAGKIVLSAAGRCPSFVEVAELDALLGRLTLAAPCRYAEVVPDRARPWSEAVEALAAARGRYAAASFASGQGAAPPVCADGLVLP